MGGDDTNSNVSRLCIKVKSFLTTDHHHHSLHIFQACTPLSKEVLKILGFDEDPPENPIYTAAVCVYPSKVPNAVATLKKLGYFEKMNVASGFLFII